MTDPDKSSLLRDAGFRYHFDREVYFDRVSRKVFSLEAIEDHDELWLSERLMDKPAKEWRFYFNSSPSSAVRDELVGELE